MQKPLKIGVGERLLLEKESDVLIDQIRAIDNTRLIKGPLAQCDLSFMKEVQRAILDVIDCRIEEWNENSSH